MSNNNNTQTHAHNNCVFCCLRARLILDPTQHRLDEAHLLYFRGHALRTPDVINHTGNPNIVIRYPIRYYIDVVREFPANDDVFATYVRGRILSPGEDGYRELSGNEGSTEVVVVHDVVENALESLVQQRFPDAQDAERAAWVQVTRQDGRWHDPHYEVWGQGWIGERRASGVVCDLHKDYRFWLIFICPRDQLSA